MTSSSVNTLVQPIGEMPPEAIVFGRTEGMIAVRDRLMKLAGANVPVLIQGESGTGKDIIARMVHANSPWRSGPWVKVNCPAIPGTLLESELFGYEKGAFTGAYGVKPGRVEMAHRGTLFLDEISELDMSLQSKLLQLLQDGQFCRIGAQEDKKVEVRVVCATNRKLEHEIENGTFRSDLFYRINVVNLHLPPLRERPEDVPALLTHFVRQAASRLGHAVSVTPAALASLTHHAWPGNVRELRNAVERAAVLGAGGPLDTKDFGLGNGNGNGNGAQAPSNGESSGTLDLKTQVEMIERRAIQRALEVSGGNRRQAASLLGISLRTLFYKLRRVPIQERHL